MGNLKGQNVVEYILLVTAVMVVCIVFASSKTGGPLVEGIHSSLNSIVNQINHINSEIKLP